MHNVESRGTIGYQMLFSETFGTSFMHIQANYTYSNLGINVLNW